MRHDPCIQRGVSDQMRSLLRTASLMALLVTITNVSASHASPGLKDGIPMGDLRLNPRDFEAFTRGFLEGAMRTNHVPGAVFVAVANHKVISCFGLGAADLQEARPMTPRTVVRTASISKVITALTVLSLCQRGQMSLDEDVNRYLSGMTIPQGPWERPVTIRNLLTHTAGFEDRWIGTEVEDPVAELTFVKSLKDIMPRRFLPPGDVYCYSNYGMALAGAAAAERSRRNFQSLAKKIVLDPLGMDRSGFVIGKEMDEDLATGYYSAPDPYPAQPVYFKEVPSISFCSTAQDMGKLITALLNQGVINGRKALPSEVVEKLLKPAFFNHPAVEGVTLGMYTSRIGYIKGVEHGGDLDGFSSLIYLAPEQNFGFFVAFNGDAPYLRDQLKEALVRRYLMPHEQNKEDAAEDKPPHTDSFPLEGLEGPYRHIRHSRSTVEKAYLMLEDPVWVHRSDEGINVSYPEAWGRPTQRFVPISQDLFREADQGLHLAVRRDRSGKVRFLFIGDAYETYEPVPAMERPAVTRWLLASFAAALLLSAAIWITGIIKVRGSRWYQDPPRWHIKWGWIFSFWADGWAFLLGLYGVDYLMGYSLRLGLPWQAKILFLMPFLGAALLIMAMVELLRGLRHARTPELILFASSSALGVQFLLFLDRWNLLGFKF